jgi:hypothetical protein
MSHTSYLGWARMIVDVFKAIAWPVAVMLLGLKFAPEVKTLVTRGFSAKAPGLELDFRQQQQAVAELSAASAAIEQSPILVGAPKEPPVADDPELPAEPENTVESMRLKWARTMDAAYGPEATPSVGLGSAEDKIAASWKKIFTALRQAGKETDLSTSRISVHLAADLRKAGAISEEVEAVIKGAKQLRDEFLASGSSEVSFLTAQVYENTASRIAERIRQEVQAWKAAK